MNGMGSRKAKSLHNALTAVSGLLLTNGMQFICRTVFIETLGREYLGISGLYADIFLILSAVELGFSATITYHLYKPLAEHDTALVNSMVDTLKRFYRLVALVIGVIGLLLLPFLPSLMKDVTDKVNIYLYYLLYLTQAVAFYLFFAYKSVLLIADQKQYINDLAAYGCQIVSNCVQIAVLLLWRSFLLYTIVIILNNIVKNLIVSCAVDRRYAFLSTPPAPLCPAVKKKLWKSVRAMAVQNSSVIFSVGIDNVLIASCINVAAVGLYDNYKLIVSVVQKLLNGCFQSLSASVGSCYASDDQAHSRFIFRCLNLLSNWIIAVCSVCFLSMFQPFITLWIGADYLLDASVLYLITLNFATNAMQGIVSLFKNASGAFVYTKYSELALVGIKLIMALALMRTMGIAGLLLASLCARMLTSWWYNPWMLFKKSFGSKPFEYYVSSFLTLLVTAVSYGCVHGIAALLDIEGVPLLMVSWALSLVIPSACFALLYQRSAELSYLTALLKKMVRRISGRWAHKKSGRP